MKTLVYAGLLSALTFFSGIASATPITVTVEGTVTNSRDDFGFFGLGNGYNTLLGASISAVFTFDSNYAGYDFASSNPNRGDYRGGSWPSPDWVTSTVDIDTSTVDSTLTPGDLVSDEDIFYDRLLIQNEDHSGSGLDRYYVIDRVRDQSPYEDGYHYAQIYSYVDNLITSLDPGQTLSWHANDFNARGIFYLFKMGIHIIGIE